MNTRRQSLTLSDPFEQLTELGPFGGTESRRHGPLVRAPDIGQAAHQSLPLGRQMQCVQPAVLGVATALDQTPALQVVDEGNDTTGQQTELVAERLLAAALLAGNRAQDAGLRRQQVECRDALGELLGGVRSELRQEERHTTGPSRCSGAGHDADLINRERLPR